jgi:3-hydroxyisobutyrate dehydrogenase-like beta-hydroxyacid dehydrogenase
MAKGSSDSFWLRNSGLRNLVPGHFPEDAFPTDYAIKDISYALELAADGGIDARAAKLTRQVLGEASAAGHGKAYYPVILKLIERGEER